MNSDKYHFFWNGPFSQWAHSPFMMRAVVEYEPHWFERLPFVTAEQWMMWNKAMMFGDEAIAERILRTPNPKEQKALGRKVTGFNDSVWMEHAYVIVVAGNKAKFTQNPRLAKQLEATKGKMLVEASPYDRRWGIGLRATDPEAQDESTWRGKNLLGKAITQARIDLFGS